MAWVNALARPPDDPYFDELLAQYGRARRFLPGLARVAQLGAAPDAKPLMAALHHLRKGDCSAVRLPVEFVSPGWLRVWSATAPWTRKPGRPAQRRWRAWQNGSTLLTAPPPPGCPGTPACGSRRRRTAPRRCRCPPSTSWKSRPAWWHSGSPPRRGCRGWTCPKFCWRCTPAPASRPSSLMPASVVPAPATWPPASAPCCWRKPATPGWSR